MADDVILQWNVEIIEKMFVKDLMNTFHLLKKMYTLLRTGWISEADDDHKQFYELPLKFRDYHGNLHDIKSSTVDFDKDGKYCVILDEPRPSGYEYSPLHEYMTRDWLNNHRWEINDNGWWRYQVTNRVPNREERRKANR